LISFNSALVQLIIIRFFCSARSHALRD
jgi:hypothetical protein